MPRCSHSSCYKGMWKKPYADDRKKNRFLRADGWLPWFVAFLLCGTMTVPIALAQSAPLSDSPEEPSLISATPRQWRVSEFSFTAREDYPYQPLGVMFSATFKGPDGETLDVPGFWDGGKTWKIRFTPTLPGTWSFQTHAVEESPLAIDVLFDSGVVRGGEAAKQVDIDVRGTQELRLCLSETEDGGEYDHCDWADARIIDDRGNVTYLETLKPVFASQGYGSLGLGRNISGKELRIAEQTFQHGLGTHAPGEIIYHLPASTVRFQAWVGIDATVGKHGSARFRVLRKRMIEANVGRRDRGLDGQHGSFVAASAEGPNPLHEHGGILKVSPDRRYLTYSDGTPFFWLADTCWFCPSDLMPIDGSSNPKIESAYKHFVETRRRQGFSAIQMDFLGTIDGKIAFSDFHQTWAIEIPFWQAVDRYVAVANAAGILPVIGMGWSGRPLAPEEWRVLWRYMVARYGSCSVTWLICGEYNVQDVADSQIVATMQLAQFIKSIDPYKRAMTIHPWYYLGDRRQAWREPWYDFIMLQGGHGSAPPITVYHEAYAQNPPRPVLEGECAYEGIHTFQAADVRNRAWRAIQSGCFGYTYGSHGLWYPTQNEHDERTSEWGEPTPWWIALSRPGATHMGYMREIYESVPWWRLRPLPGAIAIGPTPTASQENVQIVYDFVAHFDKAQTVHALWTKVIRHAWLASDDSSIELHPKGGPPATLTFPALTLPKIAQGEKLWLVLALGMDPDAKLNDPQQPSDGVTFTVKVNGTALLREHFKSKAWEYHGFDLTKQAESPIVLTLETEAGENATWDHARVLAPIIVRAPSDVTNPLRETYTLPLPDPILVKADDTNVFVIYFSATSRLPRPQVSLRGVACGAVYKAVWRDPRTGEEKGADPIQVPNSVNAASLPMPPDAQDWVLILTRRP